MAVTVARSVKQAVDEGVLIRDVSEEMILLEPDTAPLYVMTNNAKRKKPATSPRLEFIEDAEVSFWDFAAEGSDKSNSATTLTITEPTLFATNDLILIPLANTDADSEEVALVTGISGSVLTLTRNISGSGADTIPATGSIRILGGAFTENSSLPIGRYTSKTTKISYCQIFRTVVDVSNTARSTEQYGGSEPKFQLGKALQRHRQEIENAGLYGRASESTALPTSRWTSMGYKSRVTTNVTDAATTLTLTKFNTFSETAFRFGENTKLFMASARVMSALNFFSQNKLQTSNGDKIFGVNLQRFTTPHGQFLLSRNWRMEAGVSGLRGFNDEAYSIDLASVEMRYLNGNGKSRDTKLYSNVVQDGVDGIKDEYLTQMGWIIRHEKKHARIHNATDYS